jgi:hypothetical protein
VDAFTFRRVLLVLSKPAAEPGQNFYNEVHAGNFMMHLLVTDVDAWWHHAQAQGIASKYDTKTEPPGLGAYVTSCSLIRPAFFGASGKTFPRYGR